jgi:monovalent cation/hydrogen antiporter
VEHLEITVLGLLVAVAGLALLADIVNVPYPIFLVLGGLVLGFVPGIPEVELEPDLVLLIFLPPLLYSAAFFSSLRDLRANIRPIGLLSVGLVAVTAVVVAGVAHWAVGLPWAAAFVLGAIVSPTDPVAATAIAERLGVPRRIVTLLEGESLINDGTALVLYGVTVRIAIGAVAFGAFSFVEVGLRFLVGVVLGTAIGLAVGWVIASVRRKIDAPLVEITISMFTGYAAYLPAEELNSSEFLLDSGIPASGVLAAVAAGLYLNYRAPEIVSPRTRLQAIAVWDVIIFMLNSLLFILIGLQLPNVLEGLSDEPAGTLLLYAALVSLAVIVARFVWVFPATYIPRRLSRRLRERDPSPPWQSVTVIAYAGMRGAVSLAAALALPLTTLSGAAFPGRDLIIFLAFCVILVTLVLQGLSLPFLIRQLGLEDDGITEREEVAARLLAAEAALDRIEELAEEDWVREDTADRMRGLYGYRRRRFAARAGADGEDGDHEDYEERSVTFQRLRRELLEAERSALLHLRSEGKIGEQAMRRVERDLDLEDQRLEI